MLLVELALTVARNTRADPDEQGRGFLRALMAHEAISYGSIWLSPPVPGGLAEQSDELEISAPFHARTVTSTDSHKAPFNHLAEVSVPMRFMSSHTASGSRNLSKSGVKA